MRSKINAQTEIDFQPSSLKLTNRYYEKYEAISRTLEENPGIIELIHADLKSPLKYAAVKGRDGRQHEFTSDQVLRLLVCQTIEGGSLREIVIRVDDSNFLRRFVRIYNGPMMDFTTLDKLKNSIHPKTWKKVNGLLAEYAVKRDLIHGEKLRMDTTAVEMNIHWPTDSSLLWDSYRVVSRLIERARELDPEAVGSGRLHPKRARKGALDISRQASKKGESAETLKPLYKALIERVEWILYWTIKVGKDLRKGERDGKYSLLDGAMALALAEELDRYRFLGWMVVEQARRRVLEGLPVPNEAKIFSIFEPHTELLKRGKAGKDIEFGHMIQISQVREKFITDYGVFRKKPVEYTLLEPVLEGHQKLFGEYPKEVGADKGYYESREGLEKLRHKVDLVAIAKKGNRTAEETERENDPAFRHAQRFRAGVEGTISFLKRVLGLLRCFNKGWEHFVATVGATIFSHNLLILARC